MIEIDKLIKVWGKKSNNNFNYIKKFISKDRSEYN